MITVSGEIDAQVSSARLEARSVSGDAVVRNGATLSRAVFATVSGDLELSTTLAADAELTMESTSGDISLSLHGEVNARVTAGSRSGDIDNDLNGASAESDWFGPGAEVRTSVGTGTAVLELETLSGDIRISRH
ncbi:MAG: DUF4097 domain-containing protein [Gammaproteobacteria bacterium]|nr:DUF4097 domain-containing protein [Gammaproteobacteria bacterium]